MINTFSHFIQSANKKNMHNAFIQIIKLTFANQKI